jgi:hypothetical protein
MAEGALRGTDGPYCFARTSRTLRVFFSLDVRKSHRGTEVHSLQTTRAEFPLLRVKERKPRGQRGLTLDLVLAL